LTLRAVFWLALRQTEGLIGSILRLLGLDLAVPDHSTLSRRAETLEMPRPISRTEPVHLLVDGETTPTQRDRHLRSIAEHGRMAWQKRSGYNRRSLVEAAISRLKRVIGDALRSRMDRQRAPEIAIAVHALNRMLELGRPKTVRIA
jgi:hypothetical protein